MSAEFPGFTRIDEPKLLFEAFSANPYHCHPLKGLVEFGPHSKRLLAVEKIRVGVICPIGSFHIIQNLFNEFFRVHQPQERREYLPSFPGFENVFSVKPELLPENESVQFDKNKILLSTNKRYISLSQELESAIRVFAQKRLDFDVLYIYLPDELSDGFEDTDTNFNLHDYIKALAASYNIPTQIIRERRAIHYRCRCSVMWRLSIALYVKAWGIPWKLATLDEETAFIGLSYSTRFNNQTNQFDFTTCCSQVFDSDGTGLEFIAYDVGEIDFRVGDNPFLTRAEMRKLMSKSLALYQRRHSGRSPRKLIVHKTSRFTDEEIDGAFDAIPEHIHLELLQIVENSSWRGIKFNKSQGHATVGKYPVDRGCFVQSNPHEVMLWTQGVVPLNGRDYFKEGKNIPAPLLIRRWAGSGGWEYNCQAIMGLTKMNWNHDALYNKLPVTLGYAKTLASTVRRMPTMVNKPYEFKYFM